jgi:hypothetical protein
MNSTRLLNLGILLVALHSIGFGLVLFLFPNWLFGLAGFDYHCSDYFPAQMGVFLIVFSIIYVFGIWYRPFAWMLVLSKAFAVGFQVLMIKRGNVPEAINAAAIMDGVMGLLIFSLLKFEQAQRLKMIKD